MNILITGGCGYVGSTTVRALADSHNIVVVDNLSTGYLSNIPHGIKVYQYSVDHPYLRGILEKNKIEAVIHFAAKAIVQESIEHPSLYWTNNVGGSLNLFEACKEAGVKKVIISSSCAVYGIVNYKITEDICLQPINPYGQSKKMVEEIACSYAKECGWDLTILRYFNAAGADGAYGENHKPETHFIPNVILTALGRKERLDIYGNGVFRDFIHILDLADVHKLALDKGKGIQIFNVGTGYSHKLTDIISIVEFRCGKRILNQYIHEQREGDPAYLVADCSKIKAAWEWEAKRDIFDIIKDAYTYHKDYQ